MNIQPLVSIVIPCFNAECLIADAIESSLNQSYRNLEVLVIDDGSTDNSPEIIKSFKGRIKWESGPNRGGSHARNRGLEISGGKFIQFLDADDLLHPGKIQRQVAESLRFDENTIVYCGERTTDETGAELRIYCPPISNENVICFMLVKGLQTTAPLHRRALLESIGGFSERLPCGQEYDLHLRLACSGVRFSGIEDVLFTVRKRHASVSSNFPRVLDQYPSILWPAYRKLQKESRLTDALARCFAETMASAGRRQVEFGNRDRANAYFRDARLMHRTGGLAVYSPIGRFVHRLVGPRAVAMLSGRSRRNDNEALAGPG